jgi:hypothetical protein
LTAAGISDRQLDVRWLELLPEIVVGFQNVRLISVHAELLQSAGLERHTAQPVVSLEMTVVIASPIFLERQMSKRKLATASKRARNPKKVAQAQRSKQAIVKSPKDNFLRSVAAVSIEPPLKPHDDPKHDAPSIETSRVDALPSDLGQRMGDSGPTKGFALATANMLPYQAKLLEIALANGQFAFEFGLRLATIRSPVELFAVMTEFTRRRIDMFGQHAKEMAAYPFWRIDASRKLTVLPGV